MVYVPLRYPEGKGNARGERRRLMIFKDDKGNPQAQVMHLIGKRSYLKENNYQIRTDDFTGVALVYDWQGNYIYGVAYKNAEPIGDVSKITDEAAKKMTEEAKSSNDRTEATKSCTFITMRWYSTAYAGGFQGPTYLVGIDNYTICSGSGRAVIDYGDGPRGGGGGGDGNCGTAFICDDGTENRVTVEVESTVHPIDGSGPYLCPGSITATHNPALPHRTFLQTWGIEASYNGINITFGLSAAFPDLISSEDFRSYQPEWITKHMDAYWGGVHIGGVGIQCLIGV